MTFGKTLALLATLATVLGSTYIYARAHRYDIVVGAAGSNGSGDSSGQLEIDAYLVDHVTGKVRVIESNSPISFPVTPMEDLGKDPSSSPKNKTFWER
jgi:hypothetical protein